MGKSSSHKAILTAAVTGAIHTPTMSPHLPITPEQLINDIMSVHEAGGAVAHLHVRDQRPANPKRTRRSSGRWPPRSRNAAISFCA